MTALDRAVTSSYRDAPAVTRAFVELRWRWTPYAGLAAMLPSSGPVLDLGCGHGLLSQALARGSPDRRVLGVDHDAARIDLARRAARDLPNVSFERGGVEALDRGPFSGIAIIDVLHYFRFDAQEALFRKAFAALEPGGRLVFRDVDSGAGTRFQVNRLHERVMTGLRITHAEELHFRSIAGWLGVARAAGFTAEAGPHGRFPAADVVFTLSRPA